LPTNPGVYRFLDENKTVLYVGKAKDLKARVSSYFTNKGLLGEKTRMLVSQIQTIDITVVESELESLLLEAFYIKKYRPKYNIRLADDKAYPLIRITLKDSYPAIFLDRRAEDPESL
jgi:excinuclease ABC subunit C